MTARHGEVRRGVARSGGVRQGLVFCSISRARKKITKVFVLGIGKARPGSARSGGVRRGRVWQGKELESGMNTQMEEL